MIMNSFDLNFAGSAKFFRLSQVTYQPDKSRQLQYNESVILFSRYSTVRAVQLRHVWLTACTGDLMLVRKSDVTIRKKPRNREEFQCCRGEPQFRHLNTEKLSPFNVSGASVENSQ